VRWAVIVNPISGTGGRPSVARARAELAAAILRERAIEADVLLTEHPGHGRDLTRAALARGATMVAAWGGDGTVNEVASELAFTGATLAIVPSGSGNGLARELGIPLAPRDAFRAALEGVDRVIDAGELDGRLFFNVAGVGLDARVAHRFAAGGLVRRGFARYLEIAARELFTYDPDEHTIAVDAGVQRTRALLVALCNARQYGNGAVIAPDARLDDGALDVVVVERRPPWVAILQAPRLFLGRVDRVPGVTIRRGAAVEITSAHPVIYHVDGEPFVGAARIGARVHPRALRVRTPRFTRNLQP
jgi:YegS/Rv2252/BmrU family lipid kinase